MAKRKPEPELLHLHVLRDKGVDVNGEHFALFDEFDSARTEEVTTLVDQGYLLIVSRLEEEHLTNTEE